MSEQEQTAQEARLEAAKAQDWLRECSGYIDALVTERDALRVEIERLTSETATRLEAMKDRDKTIVALGAKLDFWRERAECAETQLAASQERVKRLEAALRRVRMRFEDGDPMDSMELVRLEREALAAGAEESDKDEAKEDA